MWNANGLGQHAQELKIFVQTHNIDVLLISEAHLTHRSHITISNYTIYSTIHPEETALGGTAVIIRNNIKHYETAAYRHDNIQATSMVLEDNTGDLTISAVYCPPRHNNEYDDYERFFTTLGNRFIAGGDYNAKNTIWGSRLTTTKGCELHRVILHNNLNYLSTRQPTYWPTATNKLPDLLDFCLTKGIDTRKPTVESSLELTSDHTPILITMFAHIQGKPKKPSLYTNRKNWNYFREIPDTSITLEIPLKTETDIEAAVQDLTKAIQQAAWQATSDSKDDRLQQKCPLIVRQKITEKRRARKR